MNLISNIEDIENVYAASRFWCLIQMIFFLNLVHELSSKMKFQVLDF